MAQKTKEAKKTTTKSKEFPAKQGKSQVGYAKPPIERQFKPGESGNPKGPPMHRVQLWTYVCQYMAMTKSTLNKLRPEKLTCAQQWALRIVKSTTKLSFPTMDRFARYVIDRDEGRPAEHMFIQEDQDVLTDEECEEIRQILRRKMGVAQSRPGAAK
ncbi:MAG: hypothetical protein JSW66_04795 [Phycisphaerales bacterium]|nr:MAG: hypothetical protein JSW66_04795 [Phycisphaerales bacterium]